jgi:hypothetical protein
LTSNGIDILHREPLKQVETLAYCRVTTRAIASAIVYFLLCRLLYIVILDEPNMMCYYLDGSYAAAFWYAGTLVLRDQLTTGGLVNVFFAVVLGK